MKWAAHRWSLKTTNGCTRLRRAGFPPRRKRRGFQPEVFMNLQVLAVVGQITDTLAFKRTGQGGDKEPL